MTVLGHVDRILLKKCRGAKVDALVSHGFIGLLHLIIRKSIGRPVALRPGTIDAVIKCGAVACVGSQRVLGCRMRMDAAGRLPE